MQHDQEHRCSKFTVFTGEEPSPQDLANEGATATRIIVLEANERSPLPFQSGEVDFGLLQPRGEVPSLIF